MVNLSSEKHAKERMGSELGFEELQEAEKSRHSRKKQKWRDGTEYIQREWVTLI